MGNPQQSVSANDCNGFSRIIILAVIAIGLILAILILNTEQHQDTHQELNHTLI